MVDDDLKTAMQSLRQNKNGISNPETPTVKPVPETKAVKRKGKNGIKRKGKPVEKKEESGINQSETPMVPVILDDDTNLDPKIDLKSQLTLKELKFIGFYLTGNMTIEKAMIAAGYEGYSQNGLYFRAKKIIGKYESQAGDHRKIMREMGYGEVKAIQMLIDSAENARSETVKLNARIALAKALGLQKEVVEGAQGVKIIINAADGSSLKVGVCTPPNPENPLPQAVTITK